MRNLALLALAAACGGQAQPTQVETTHPAGASEPASEPLSAPPPAASTSRPASVTDDMVRTTDRFFEVLDRITKDVGAAADCKAATAALRAHEAEIHAVSADANQIERAWAHADADAQRWFEATYRPRQQAMNEAMMNRVASCKADPDFKAAFDAFNNG